MNISSKVLQWMILDYLKGDTKQDILKSYEDGIVGIGERFYCMVLPGAKPKKNIKKSIFVNVGQ